MAERSPGLDIQRDGMAASARLVGPVNEEHLPVLERSLETLLAGECRALVLDLSAADYVDSDGIRWLRRLQVQAESRGIALRVRVRAGSRIERTMRLVQLDQSLCIDPGPVPVGPAPAAAAEPASDDPLPAGRR